jgi:hypothetical protein
MSSGSVIALTIVMIAGVAFGTLDAVMCFPRRNMMSGIVIFGFSLEIAAFILPFLTRPWLQR